MPTSLIGRMVFLDLLKITLLTVTGISALFVMGGAMIEANKFGMEPQRVLMLLPFLIPPTLPYTLPVSILFACTFVYSRLASNQELVALKAGGVHSMRIIAPALLIGISFSVLSVYLVDQFIPRCHRQMSKMLMDDLESSIYAYLRQTGAISRPDFEYEVFASDVRDDKLIKATFKHRTSTGQYDLVAQAEEATLTVVREVGPEGDLEPFVNLRLMDHRVLTREGLAHVRDQTYQMPVPEDVGRREIKSLAMSCYECLQESEKQLDKARTANYDLSLLATCGLLNGNAIPALQMEPLNRLYAHRQARRARELQGEVNGRLAQAASAFMFVLLGCPVGILFQRRDFLQTFFVCFLPICTIYYPALILSQNIVKEGLLPAYIAVWTPTVLLSLSSIPLILRVIRY